MNSPVLLSLFSDLGFDNHSSKALYIQLAENIQILIKKGKLLPGERLPSTRMLSDVLNLNRLTINKAYQELTMQGWIYSHTGKGSFVSPQLPEINPTGLGTGDSKNPLEIAGFQIEALSSFRPVLDEDYTKLHLDDGYPDPKLAPLKELYRAYRTQLTRGGLYHKFGRYSVPTGSHHLRQVLADYLNHTRALHIRKEHVLTVRGTVMGINLVCNGLIKKGDIVVSGVPGWKRAEQNFQHAGAQHIGIPVDEEGIVLEALEEICKVKPVRMVYVTPHHHYPTTVSLPMHRRLALLRLAERYGFIIFEDDYDFDFHYKHKPLLPLASADENGMVIYCGSFSKSFSPAFRLGYLIASKNVIEHLSAVRLILDRQGDHILENAMAELIEDGTIQRYLRKALTVYQDRRDVFCKLLQTELSDYVEFQIPEGGMTVWTTFNRDIDLGLLSQRCKKQGLFFSDGKIHQYKTFKVNATRLGFASSTPEELEESIAIIRKQLK